MWRESIRLILAFAIVLTAGAGPALAQGATVEFITLDTETQGNWKDAYGTDGYHIVLDTEAYPSYAEVSFTNASTWTWVASTTDVRGLETAAGGDRLHHLGREQDAHHHRGRVAARLRRSRGPPARAR